MNKIQYFTILESCIDHILYLNHNSLFGAYHGSPRTFWTIRQKFFIPHIMHYIRSFRKGWQICQLHKVRPTPQRQFKNRINLNYTSKTELSCDIKYMYRTSTGQRFILVVADEVTNYLVTIPLYRGTSHEVGEAFINHVFCKHSPLFCI